MLLLPLLGALALSVYAKTLMDPDTEEEAMAYLKQFGYLQKPLESDSEDFSSEEVQKAIQAFQLASQMPETGVLDNATLERMRQPRCGLEDPFNQVTLRYLLLGRWRKKSLTYRIYNYTPDMTKEKVREAIKAAFKYWSDITPLKFREIDYGRADIRISFHQRGVGCSRPFDGPGKVLAHADIPELGTVHFDEDEEWTEGSFFGVNLRIIAAHELGHALGLGHSYYSNALMAPVYAGYRPNFRLHNDDVKGMQALYGAICIVLMQKNADHCIGVVLPCVSVHCNAGSLVRDAPQNEYTHYGPDSGKNEKYEEEKKPVTTLAPAVPTPTSPVPDPCHDNLDAIILGPYGKTYAFKGDYVWTITDYGIGPLSRIQSMWKGLPGNLDAAVHSKRTKRTYFFKGDKFWRYTDFKLNYGYPKVLTRVPPNISAALFWEGNQKIFLLKGDEYWQWDELAWSILQPKKISSLFTGVPGKLDAALTWKNGKIYFFKGDKYWRVNKQLRVDRGYPLSKAERWMQCIHLD